jgi:hypothetical protein
MFGGKDDRTRTVERGEDGGYQKSRTGSRHRTGNRKNRIRNVEHKREQNGTKPRFEEKKTPNVRQRVIVL